MGLKISLDPFVCLFLFLNWQRHSKYIFQPLSVLKTWHVLLPFLFFFLFVTSFKTTIFSQIILVIWRPIEASIAIPELIITVLVRQLKKSPFYPARRTT